MSGWPELGKAALDVLGKSAPWVIIVCLSAFGIYKLQEQNQQNLVSIQGITEKERNQARQDFEVANKALKDTYEAANKLYTDMMTSMGNSLKQLHSLESDVRDKQKSVYESEVAAERTKAKLESQQAELTKMQQQVDQAHSQAETERRAVEDAKKETVRTQAARIAAEAAVQELSVRLAREKADLEVNSRQLDETKRQVEEKRNELKQAVARLRDVGGLANELAGLSDNPTNEDINALRRKARAILPSLNDFFKAYRDEPGSRQNLDLSAFVGMKIGELRTSIEATNGFLWFVGYGGFSGQHHETKLVAIADDESRNDLIRSVIVIQLSDLPTEKESALDSNPSTIFDEPLTVSGIQLSSAAAYRCIDPDGFDSVNIMYLSNIGAVRGIYERPIGQNVEMMDVLRFVFQFGGRMRQLKGQKWLRKILSPSDVLKAVPEILRPKVTALRNQGPFVCLDFLVNREFLATIDIKINGLTESEGEMVRSYLSSAYRSVFNAKQEFIEAVDFSEFVSGSKVKSLGPFISGMARMAMLNKSELGSVSTVPISVTRERNKYRLQLDQPSNAPTDIKRTEPLYLELVDNKLTAVEGFVPSN